MGFLPQLSELNISRDMISEFGGYNHNLRIGQNEFYGMKNMSSDSYPVLSPRKKRRRVRAFTAPKGLYMHNSLCWIDGSKFYYGGVEKGTLYSGTDPYTERTLIGMGAYVLIFPDKKYYNSSDDTFGDLANSRTTSGTVTITLTKISGDAYTLVATQATAPEYHEKGSYWCKTAANDKKLYLLGDTSYTQVTPYSEGSTAPSSPASGQYWLDTSSAKHVLKKYGTAWTAVLEEFVEAASQPVIVHDGSIWLDTGSTPHCLKQYSASYSMWSPVATTYVKIAATNIGKGFAEYDGVTISGMSNSALNGEFTLYGVADDYIIIAAIIDAVATQSAAVTVSRDIPSMDYVTELNNRIWGCSNTNHEIYACKLGDPKVWKQNLGISTDSFAVTVGSKGNFTGAVTQLGSVLFFKEDIIHELYGSKPSNFKIQDSNVRGVKTGCAKSIAVVNETLFYVSKQDVCSFGTSVPREASYAFGGEVYTNAVGAACGNKYYLSAKDSANNYHLFVYDIAKNLWHVEDNTQIKYAASVGNDLLFIASDNVMYSVNGATYSFDDSSAAAEDDFEWYVETGEIGLEIPDRKYITKIQFRVKVEPDAIVRISVMYDNSGSWEELYRINNTRLNTYTACIIPHRCDTMRVKIQGTGKAEIYDMAKCTEGGSNL